VAMVTVAALCQAAALGLAAGVGYGLTAAVMESALAGLAKGPLPFLTSWQLYGTAIAGVGALFLFQNSLQAGYLMSTRTTSARIRRGQRPSGRLDAGGLENR
jgi:hypothetical protein